MQWCESIVDTFVQLPCPYVFDSIATVLSGRDHAELMMTREFESARVEYRRRCQKPQRSGTGAEPERILKQLKGGVGNTLESALCWQYPNARSVLNPNTGRGKHWYEGIADTFVQLFLFCIAVLIANVYRRQMQQRCRNGRWRPTVTADG